MTQLIIKAKDVNRLLKEGILEREMVGDAETGRVFWTIKDRTFYYHRAKLNKNYYIREILY